MGQEYHGTHTVGLGVGVSVEVDVAVSVKVHVTVRVDASGRVTVTSTSLLSVEVGAKNVIVAERAVWVTVSVGAISGNETSNAAPTMIRFTIVAASRIVPMSRRGVIRKQIFFSFRMAVTPQIGTFARLSNSDGFLVSLDQFLSQPGLVCAAHP